MALGAITPQTDQPFGNSAPLLGGDGCLKMSVTNVVGDSSYPTGGSVLTADKLGLNTVLFAQTELQSSSGATNAASAAYNVATSKLQAYANTGAEVANTTNTSTATWQIIAWGY